MKTKLLVFLLAIVSGSLYAQENYEDTGFGLELYPHLSNRRLLSNGSLSFAEVTYIDSLEQADWGYGIGAFYYERNERIGFHVGLRYLSTGYRVIEHPLLGIGRNTVREKYTTQLLELPFQFNFYQNISPKTSLYFTLGAAASLHINSITERSINNGNSMEVMTDATYRKINIAMIAAVGVQHQFDKITIGLQPTFEYWLAGNTVIDDNTPVSRNLYNIGLRLTTQLSTY